MTNLLVAEQYERMSDSERIAYLQAHVGEDTRMTETFLLAALQREVNPLAKWYLIKGLGIHRSTSALPRILRVCKEPEVRFEHTSLHAICAWSLGRIGEPALAPTKELLSERDVEIRRCAVDALGEIRHPDAIEALCLCMENDEPPVQLWAALSLAKIGQTALPCLHEIVRRNVGRKRILALDAIIKIGSADSVLVLAHVLRNGTKEEKVYILENARRFYRDLIDEIKISSASPDLDVAKAASAVLPSFKGPKT